MRRRKPPSAHAQVDARAAAHGYELVAGVDEVGLGAMAGPVVAAAVIIPTHRQLELVADSKTLSPKRREEAFEEIKRLAVAWAVAVIEPEIVDRLNVYRASHQAMAEAVLRLQPQPDFVLVDGRKAPRLPVPHRALVDGDALSPAIGAASVVAKVVRDRIMERLELLYPGYGLALHKGYCTRQHRQAVAELGPTPIHRRSFAPVADCSALRLKLDGLGQPR